MGMRTTIALLLLLGACTYPGAEPVETLPTTTGGNMIEGEVFIQETSISIAESFPMQIFLSVVGELPTPCNELVWEVEELPGRFDVTMWSEIDMAVSCIAVVEPFEVSIKLGETEGGIYEIHLNGELIETIDV
jgi:hypothetical protein